MISPMRESELVERSLPLIPQMVHSGAKLCLALDTEVGVGSSIVDIVALAADEKFQHLNSGLTLRESVILSQLRRHGATRIDLLEQRCRLPRGCLRNGALDRVAACGLVDIGKGGRIELGNDSVSSCTIVAIEAKLQRWKEALNQAVEYRRFADHSFVLLPARYARLAEKNRLEFEKKGIGLWVFEADEIACLIEGRQASNHCWRREFVISRLAKVREQETVEHIAHNRRHQSGITS